MEEHGTTTWYAVRFSDDDFAIFDTFAGNAARLAHLAGKVGRALIAHSSDLFESMPDIEEADVLTYKLPGESG